MSLKLAIITHAISHFEVPLYKLCNDQPDLEIRVFYTEFINNGPHYDKTYQQEIDWGQDLLTGYETIYCSNAYEVIQNIRQFNPNAVLMNGYAWPGAIKIIFLNWFGGIPQIHRGPLNYYKDPRNNFIKKLKRPLRPFILRIFQAHHYSGEHSKKVLLDAGIHPNDLFFVPYSVDSAFFMDRSIQEETTAENLRSTLGWTKDDKVILYIGQHNWFKGPDIAMEVISEFQKLSPETRALIVGRGCMTDAMLAYAREHLIPHSYYFAGFVPNKDTVRYYLASDIVIFTTRYETWARAVNEAMLCRRVCIVNKSIPASGGLVKHQENGFVVDSPNTTDYVVALKDYFTFSDCQKELMKDRARNTASAMSYENHIEDFKKSIIHAISR